MRKLTRQQETSIRMIEKSLQDCKTAPCPHVATAWAEAQIEMAYALWEIDDKAYKAYRERLEQMPGRKENKL